MRSACQGVFIRLPRLSDTRGCSDIAADARTVEWHRVWEGMQRAVLDCTEDVILTVLASFYRIQNKRKRKDHSRQIDGFQLDT